MRESNFLPEDKRRKKVIYYNLYYVCNTHQTRLQNRFIYFINLNMQLLIYFKLHYFRINLDIDKFKATSLERPLKTNQKSRAIDALIKRKETDVWK